MDHSRCLPLGKIAQFTLAVLFISVAALGFCSDAAQNEGAWAKATPESVNMDPAPMIALSQEFETGKPLCR